MFGLVSVPKAQPLKKIEAAAPPEEYLALRAKIGMGRPQPANRLAQYLEEKGIPVYPTALVSKFLAREAAKEQKRQRKAKTLPDNQTIQVIWVGHGEYRRHVPYPVLKLMAEIKEAMPPTENVGFWISDYQAVRPDPFLSVGIIYNGRWEQYVVAHWDEPNWEPFVKEQTSN